MHIWVGVFDSFQPVGGVKGLNTVKTVKLRVFGSSPSEADPANALQTNKHPTYTQCTYTTPFEEAVAPVKPEILERHLSNLGVPLVSDLIVVIVQAELLERQWCMKPTEMTAMADMDRDRGRPVQWAQRGPTACRLGMVN